MGSHRTLWHSAVWDKLQPNRQQFSTSAPNIPRVNMAQAENPCKCMNLGLLTFLGGCGAADTAPKPPGSTGVFSSAEYLQIQTCICCRRAAKGDNLAQKKAFFFPLQGLNHSFSGNTGLWLANAWNLNRGELTMSSLCTRRAFLGWLLTNTLNSLLNCCEAAQLTFRITSNAWHFILLSMSSVLAIAINFTTLIVYVIWRFLTLSFGIWDWPVLTEMDSLHKSYKGNSRGFSDILSRKTMQHTLKSEKTTRKIFGW